VFTTCIHCNTDLGRNEAFAVFPIGTRLAFDAAKGRLWVVCRRCERWNLSPLDERWEAIEEAERRYRDSRLRASTDNVGMARLREGVDLIRIGVPQRPEMAAWRYGDQFGRRRRKQLLLTGVAMSGAAAVVGGFLAAGIGLGIIGGWAGSGADLLINGRGRTIVGRLTMPDGKLVTVRRRQARMSVLARDGDSVALRLESDAGPYELIGDAAMKAAARLLPTVNRFGGSRKQVSNAVAILERAGDARAGLRHVQLCFGAKPGDVQWRNQDNDLWGSPPESAYTLPGALHGIPQEFRLALEMALHEESERRAMDGELAMLAEAWREAEEIAQIADTLFVSPAVESKLEQLRGGSARPPTE